MTRWRVQAEGRAPGDAESIARPQEVETALREALGEIANTTLGNVKAWFDGSPRYQVFP